MEKRTAEIIMCLKGNFSPYMRKPVSLGWYYNTVAWYMADRCDIDPKIYTKSDIFRIIREAVKDYISTCDNPAALLSDYFSFCDLDDCSNGGIYDECQRWCVALSNVRVRKGEEYVNGFDEQLVGFVNPIGM